MPNTSVTKVSSAYSPVGSEGQIYLASGIHVSMRLWKEQEQHEPMEPVRRDYETVGYVISGRAELHIEGQILLLEPGDSWTVPRHESHTYIILEPFTALEATAPPAQVHDREDKQG